MARFQNPANGYVEHSNSPVSWLWVLLFGPFYFIARGIWTHAIISLVAAIVTVGLSWLVYPFAVYAITNNHYRRQGWVQLP